MTDTEQKDIEFMKEALTEAKKTEAYGDVPIGAVIVRDDQIIGRGYNQVEKNGNATAHAELIAIQDALQNIDYKHLIDCTLYVTLEPCSMCAGSVILSRIPRVVFGAKDPKAGAAGSIFNILDDDRLNHKAEIVSGVMRDDCSEILRTFFKNIRENKTKKSKHD